MNLAYFNRTPLGRLIRNLLGSFLLAIIFTGVVLVDRESNLRVILISFAWAFAIASTQWLGHSYFFTLLDRKYPWRLVPRKRSIIGFFTIILYAVLAYSLVSLLMSRIVYGEFPENPLKWGIQSSYTTILISFAISLMFLAFGFFRSWKESLLEAERFKSEMLMYKYEALQNQINPHFLFNSFNVLSELVYEDRDKAKAFINQLSELFRYVLDSRDKELVPLSEELEFIKSYAYLIQTRFEDKLSIELDIECESDEMIVPMALQLLIENCVKHNEISAKKPLIIKVLKKEEVILVSNNIQIKNIGQKKTGTGLSNLKQQYSYFTNEELHIDETGGFFTVTVPVLKVNEK